MPVNEISAIMCIPMYFYIFFNSKIFHLQLLLIMGILETELAELQQCVPRVIADSTVEACVPAMVRVNIE